MTSRAQVFLTLLIEAPILLYVGAALLVAGAGLLLSGLRKDNRSGRGALRTSGMCVCLGGS
jgi:hypothetical protein